MSERKQIDILLHLIDEGFDAAAWHGPNLRGAIRGVTPSAAARRPGRGRHSIWEIVVHTAYWKYAVRRRITGEKRGSFPLRGSNWFVRPDRQGGRTWKQDVALLDEEHRRLRQVVEALVDADLPRMVGGKKMTILRLVAGIGAHDIYHAGQIRLLKRLAPGGRPA